VMERNFQQAAIAVTKSLEGLLKSLLKSNQRIAAWASTASFFLPRNKYLAIVGTMVRERKYEASMANTTASASGTNRYRATPDSEEHRRNTMQIESVETNAGVAICDALPEQFRPDSFLVLPPGCD